MALFGTRRRAQTRTDARGRAQTLFDTLLLTLRLASYTCFVPVGLLSHAVLNRFYGFLATLVVACCRLLPPVPACLAGRRGKRSARARRAKRAVRASRGRSLLTLCPSYTCFVPVRLLSQAVFNCFYGFLLETRFPFLAKTGFQIWLLSRTHVQSTGA